MTVREVLCAWLLELEYREIPRWGAVAGTKNPPKSFRSYGNQIMITNPSRRECVIYGLVTNDSTVFIGWSWTRADEDMELELADPESLETARRQFQL